MKEPGNTITHLIGAILSAVGMVFMLYKAIALQSGIYIAGALIFGFSLIALYSASTIYHWVSGSEKLTEILRKVDHAMIFVLIAGTYTPVCLVTLKGVLGYSLLAVVWTLALTGIGLKLVFMNAPRWLYTGAYVFLGWVAIFFIWPIYKAMPLGGFALLVTGGLLYTIGSVIYATKSKKINLFGLGFHEIFHLFILGGSLSHFVMVSEYVMR